MTCSDERTAVTVRTDTASEIIPPGIRQLYRSPVTDLPKSSHRSDFPAKKPQTGLLTPSPPFSHRNKAVLIRKAQRMAINYNILYLADGDRTKNGWLHNESNGANMNIEKKQVIRKIARHADTL